MPNGVIWKNFPEINRRVAFGSTYQGAGINVGCHCGSISNVQLTFGSGYWAVAQGKNIEILDKVKEPEEIKYTIPRYSDYGILEAPKAEVAKVIKYLRDTNFKFSDAGETGYEDIVRMCSVTPIWVLSDVINMESPARDPSKVADRAGLKTNPTYIVVASTRDFAKYLIDNKVGYVFESPIVQNPNHRTKDNYSLNKVWIWIPPTQLERSLNTGAAYGEEQFPSPEQWTATVGFDLGIQDPDKILKQALNDGILPRTTERFQRRSIDGRFAAKEA